MAHVTFDTLKFVEKLKDSGMPEKQAKALAEAQQDLITDSAENLLATKADINTVKSDINNMRLELSDVKSDVKLMKWMIGFALATNVAILFKVLF